MPDFNPTNQEPPMQMLRIHAVIQRTGLSRSTIYELIAAGKFPQQVKTSERTAAWLASEVDEYLSELVTKRDGVSV